MQIVGSWITMSLSNGEAAMAEAIKFQLVNEGSTFDALTLVGLYRRFSALTRLGGCSGNKWVIP